MSAEPASTPAPEKGVLAASIKRSRDAHDRVKALADGVGSFLVEGFHLLALFAIGAAIVWSAAAAFSEMMLAGRATIRDILLLFIYMELGAMVGIYFKTNRMPVRYLIYVAITALTRFMIDIVNVEHKPDMSIIVIAGAILLLALAVLALRFGSFKYPSAGRQDETDLPQVGAAPQEKS